METAVETIKGISDSLLRANSWGLSTHWAWRPIRRKSELKSRENANDN